VIRTAFRAQQVVDVCRTASTMEKNWIWRLDGRGSSAKRSGAAPSGEVGGSVASPARLDAEQAARRRARIAVHSAFSCVSFEHTGWGRLAPGE